MTRNHQTVLIVDDSPEDRETYRRYLLQNPEAHYTILEAESGEGGLELCQSLKPDGILLDYLLPDLDGLEFLSELRTQTNAIAPPVIMLTGQGNEFIAVQAMKAGAQDYLVKGRMTPETLRLTVDGVIEKAQLRTQLQRSEERLKLALEATRIGIWEWNILTGEVMWSQSLELLFGLAPGAFAGTYEAMLERVHPDDLDSVTQTFARSLEQRSRYQVEYRVLQPDGSIHWIASQGQIFYDGAGKPVRMIGATQDISDRKQTESALQQAKDELELKVAERTAELVSVNRQLQLELEERQRAEEELRLSEAKLRLSAAQIPTILWLTDTDLRLNSSLGAGLGQLALEPSQYLGKTLYELWDTDASSFPPIKAHLSALKGESAKYEYKLEERVFDVRVEPFRDAQDQIVGCIGLALDITERKWTEQKLQEQAALLNIATDAIFVQALSNHILFWNKGAEQLYGWTAESELGKNTNELLYKEALPQLKDVHQIVAQLGEWHGELHQVTASGQEIIVNSRWALVRNEQEKPKAILVVNTDITQKKQLEAQFLRAQRLESIGTLASGIAHDLNNILTPILTSAQLLQLQLPNANKQHQRYLKTVETNAKRGAALVKQVLSFARGVEGKRTILQVRHLLLEIKQIVQQTFPKSIEVATNIPQHLWLVSADATQLHQVLMNLVVNARDAMLDGGTLNLSAENIFIDETYARMNLDAKVGPFISITVSDTGTGIPPEIVERIFEPFFTTKELGQGTGLGLSTVMGILKSHGGYVSVSSEVGKGTQFKVFLPAVEATETSPVEDMEVLTGQGELILVVDDEASIREITKATLEAYNYKVLTANEGIEAISLYAQHKDEISVVLTDMMMPSMTGQVAIRILQRINPQIKIIAVSGLASNDKVALTAGVGVKAFLSKPYTARELLNTINGVLSASPR